MIKFFRHIRKSLLMENKTGKYFKYAIGEIVLVVIGILIALQINNWNQQRLSDIEEQTSLKSLHSEFLENVENFKNIIKLHANKRDAINRLLFSDVTKYSVDELDSINSIAVRNWTFNASFGIYDALINSGKIELISNTSLKNRISKFKELVNDYLEEENNIIKYTDQHVLSYVTDESNILTETRFGFRERSDAEKITDLNLYHEQLKSKEYRNRLSVVKVMQGAIFEEGELLKKEMKSIIESIEKELEQ